MSLSNLFSSSLPKLSGGGSVSDSVISYATAPVSQLLNEGYAKVQSTFRSVGNFVALSAKSPSFAALGSVNGAIGELTALNPIPGLASAAANINTASGTAAQINLNNGSNTGSTTSHKVMLVATDADGGSRVEFDNMPEVNEVRTAEYEAISAPQMPGEFQKFRGTKSTQWTIVGTFIARTREEAKRNYFYLNTLRGWTMPYFGQNQDVFAGKVGAPPPVIKFSGWRNLVGSVPVVVTGVNWNWPKECDWLPSGVVDPESGQEIPFPTVMNVSVMLVESFSAQQFNGFDLVAFRNGRMISAFSPLGRADSQISRSEAIGGQQGITNGTPTPIDDEHSATISEANESVATPTRAQNPAPAAGLPAATGTPGNRRLVEITKEITNLEAGRAQYNAILTNPATPDQTKKIMTIASSSATTKISDLKLERSKLDLIF